VTTGRPKVVSTSRPAHLRELVPDIAERDVYVCGPPGLTDVLERNVRAAGVPKRFIHAERFAL
jgi:ferredoxin-NADP reductase